MTEKEAIRILGDTVLCSPLGQAAFTAIEYIKKLQQYREIGTLEELERAKRYIDLAKRHGTIGKVIDECAAYEEIGTVEECREAVEKQKEKKCVIDHRSDHMYYRCPSCGQIQLSTYAHGFSRLGRITKYCENCGQALAEKEGKID